MEIVDVLPLQKDSTPSVSLGEKRTYVFGCISVE